MDQGGLREAGGDLEILGHLPAFVPSWDMSCGVRSFYPSLTLVQSYARSINDKTTILQSNVLEQAVDLACMTETWVQEDEILALNYLIPPSFLVLYQFQTNGQGGSGTAHLRGFLLQSTPIPWNFWYWMCGPHVGRWGENGYLVGTLLELLEVISGWALEYPRLLGIFIIHVYDAVFSQAKDLVSSMAALGLSQFVSSPTHQVGLTLDLIFGARIMMDLITADPVPLSDHFPLKACLGILSPPCLDSEHIEAYLQNQMDPNRFQEALQDPIPLGNL